MIRSKDITATIASIAIVAIHIRPRRVEVAKTHRVSDKTLVLAV